jgi:hypothetical protein
MNAGIYFITGKLGGGKSLISVSEIQNYLARGSKVATNLDIKLHNMFHRKSKKPRLMRIPDKPKACDMEALGSGNESYDEEKNGLIVLDECGTWFNARDWNDPDRKKLLEWLLFARKLGWDIIFLVQDISMIDKQARKSVSEHVGYCRRVDKMQIPFFDPVCKLLTGRPIPKPKMHVCVVRLGDLPHSPKCDTLAYTGTHLYASYDTKQTFRDNYPHGLHSILTPWHTHGRYQKPRNWNFVMRISKIYLRKFSKVLVLSGGIVAGAFIASFMAPDVIQTESAELISPIAELQIEEQQTEVKNLTSTNDNDLPLTLSEKFTGFVVDGMASDSDGKVIYTSISNGKDRFNVDGLRSQGYVVRLVNKCEVLIMTRDRSETTRLFTTYCGSDNPSQQLSNLSPSQRYQAKLEQVIAIERSL